MQHQLQSGGGNPLFVSLSKEGVVKTLTVRSVSNATLALSFADLADYAESALSQLATFINQVVDNRQRSSSEVCLYTEAGITLAFALSGDYFRIVSASGQELMFYDAVELSGLKNVELVYAEICNLLKQ